MTGAYGQQTYTVSTQMSDEIAHIRLTNQSPAPIEVIWWGAKTDPAQSSGSQDAHASWTDYYDVRAGCGTNVKLIPQGGGHSMEAGLLTHPPIVTVYAVGYADGRMVSDGPYPKYVELLHADMLSDLDKVEGVFQHVQANTTYSEVMTKLKQLKADAEKQWAAVHSGDSGQSGKASMPGAEIYELAVCESRMFDAFIESVNGSDRWTADSAGNFPTATNLLKETIPAMRNRLQASSQSSSQRPSE
jgi:hypothetical protein